MPKERREDMNRVVIVMTAKAGKAREVMAGLKAIGEYIGAKYDRKGDVFMQLHGSAGTIYIMTDYKDLASAQAAQAQVMADDGYWAIAQKFADLLVDPPTITLLQPV